jgi:transcriptional regulator with XRE-family HTH domain
MKDRIMQVMKAKGMTQQEFANATGISPAGLSNIFNGRTNPTYGHLSKIHESFPDVNISWLFFNEGEMFSPAAPNSADGEGKTPPAGGGATGTPPSSTPAVEGSIVGYPEGLEYTLGAASTSEISRSGRAVSPTGDPLPARETIREIVKYTDKPQRKITEIRIFFDDGTYETFGPK